MGCDIGDKGYLTPLEFSDLSSNLGVHLSTAELREAMMLIDEDSNGKVELIEYIEWWGDEQVVDELLNKNKGENKGGDRSTWPLEGSESKSRSATKKTKKIKSRSIEMGLQEESLYFGSLPRGCKYSTASSFGGVNAVIWSPQAC